MSQARLELAYFAANVTAELGEVQSGLGGLGAQISNAWNLERERDRVAQMDAEELRKLYMGMYEVVAHLKENLQEEKALLVRMDQGIQEARYLEWYGGLTSPVAAMFFMGWANRCSWFYWFVLTGIALVCDGPTTVLLLAGTAFHWTMVTLGETRLVRWIAGRRRATPPVLPTEAVPAEEVAGADHGVGWGAWALGLFFGC